MPGGHQIYSHQPKEIHIIFLDLYFRDYVFYLLLINTLLNKEVKSILILSVYFKPMCGVVQSPYINSYSQ